MSEDRSLDEFATDREEREASAGADDSRGDDSNSVDTAETSATGDDTGAEGEVDPVESTYSWSPSGATCVSCGATVEGRWRDDGDLVCGDCKSW